MAVANLTVSPAGGELAFIETDNASYAIKVISYNPAGVAQTPAVVPQAAGCVDRGLDIRSDGTLIFSQQCNQGSANGIKAWDSTNGVSTLLDNLAPDAPFLLRWLRDGSGFIWQATTANGIELRESSNANPSSWVKLWQIPTSNGGLLYLDMAHQSDAFLASFGSQAQAQRYSFDTISGVNAA